MYCGGKVADTFWEGQLIFLWITGVFIVLTFISERIIVYGFQRVRKHHLLKA